MRKVEDRGGPAQPLLIVNGLSKHFPLKKPLLDRSPRRVVRAVDDISFTLPKGGTLGVVGESGCGKSTTARLLMHLVDPDRGDVIFDGEKVGAHDGMTVRAMRRQMQMVFQDSYASLNPRLTILETIAFGPVTHGTQPRAAREQAADLLARVGLDPVQFQRRYPHELSGGQRQRVNIARALALGPRLLILDEAVSALDKSVEAQVLNLLAELKEQFDLTYLFISHDLNVVHYISDEVMVMYLGKVVEIGPVEVIYGDARHPYTRALLASRPSMDPDVKTREAPIVGDPPNPIDPPSGCRFRTRCTFAEEVCARLEPPLVEGAAADHRVACHMNDPASGHSRTRLAA
ncbi:dipeptide/oligopeptide/nickel ABC transporter ATP-binding protein [Allostella vacuolata]|nr:dipeptide/oligopeptide/nickel ABC transporter ATP-binding protein [Stella vacuolata]